MTLRQRTVRLACTLAVVVSAALASAVTASPAAAQTAYQGVHVTPANTFFLQLDVYGASTAPGTGVIDWWTNGGANQSWNFVSYGDGNTWEIQNRNSGFCLATDGVPGDQVFQEPCDLQPNQLWNATPQTNGTFFTIQSKSSGLYLDVNSNSSWPGAIIDTWWWNGNSNQLFTFD
jgi:hypothetical protein